MKSKVVLILCILFLVIDVLVASFFVGDKEAPQIVIKEDPKLSCNCAYDDLINYAEAVDNNNIKSFFIEDKDISNIIDNKTITYVAIDESNNVSKLKANVIIGEDYSSYHIDIKEPLVLQKDSKFIINNYFELKNECGITINDRFKVSDFDIKKLGIYDIKVESTMHRSSPLYTTVEVIDATAPHITLSRTSLSNYTNRYWSEDYLKEYIDVLEDDVDDYDFLFERVKTNWEEVMHPDKNGKVTRAGDYVVTFTVTDSDNNKTEIKLPIHLEEEIIIPVEPVEESGGEGNE